MRSIVMLSGLPSKAEMVPAAKRRESPGRNGVTTKPVSQKIIANNSKYVQT